MKSTVLKYLALVSILTGCMTYPQNKAEFRDQMNKGSTSWFSKTGAQLKNTSLQTMDQRMTSFSKKCLSRVNTFTTSRLQNGMKVGGSQTINTYHPSLERSSNQINLYLQHHMSGTTIGKVPEKGVFIFWANAKTTKDSGILLTIHYANSHYVNLGSDALEWMSGKGEFCPKLP